MKPFSNELPRRVINCLTKAGFSIEKEAIVHALQTGKLFPYCWPPNYGKYTHRDVCRWAGVDPATLPKDWPDTDHTPYPADGLSYRAHNILWYAGIPATKESVIQALNTGALSPYKRPGGVSGCNGFMAQSLSRSHDMAGLHDSASAGSR